MLKNEEVDMIAAALTVTYKRSSVVDFTNTFYTDPISIMIHLPAKNDMLWRLVSLFSLQTWVSILCGAILSVLVVYILHRYSAEPDNGNKGLNNIRKCVWYIVCCLTNQGVEDQPKTWSAQNFLALWCLASFVLISMYSGGLIAMLTTNQITTPIKDLKGLTLALENGEYTMCIESGTALYDIIMGTDSEDYLKIRRWLAKHPNYIQSNSVSCTETFLNTENMAYLAELTFLQQFQIEHCAKYPLIILDDQFSTGNFAFAVGKGSRLNSLMSPSIINARECGLIAIWKQKYSAKNRFCDIKTPNEKVTAKMDQLGLDIFGGSFVILGIGLFVSVASFYTEVHHFKLSQFWAKKRQKLGKKNHYFVRWKNF